MSPGPDLADLMVRVLLELVRDALLRLISSVSVEELAFVAVRTLLAVRTGLEIGVTLAFLQKLLQSWTVPSHGVIRGHKPETERGKLNHA